MKSRKMFVWIGAILIVFGILVLFSLFGNEKTTGNVVDDTSNLFDEALAANGDKEVVSEPSELEVDRLDLSGYTLTDILSGDEFFIQSDVPIVLETFAVWCPNCLKQQKEIKKMHEEIGNAVLSITLNVDPNEDAELVRGYIIDNGFDWSYAISPEALTRELIDKFGSRVVNAPSEPVIVLCPDGTYNFLKRGHKTKATLIEEVAKCNG